MTDGPIPELEKAAVLRFRAVVITAWSRYTAARKIHLVPKKFTNRSSSGRSQLRLNEIIESPVEAAPGFANPASCDYIFGEAGIEGA